MAEVNITAVPAFRQQFESLAYDMLETDREFGNPVSAWRLIAINSLALAAMIEQNGQPLSDTERTELRGIAASISTAALSLANGEPIRMGQAELAGVHLLRPLH